MRILDDDAGLFAAEIETESIDGSEATVLAPKNHVSYGGKVYGLWRGWYAWSFTVPRRQTSRIT
jgi:hypothetical protein